MTKEEIALQLTLARIGHLVSTENVGHNDSNQDQKFNESIARDTVKMYNLIYNELFKNQ